MNTLNRPTALAIGAIALIAGAIGPWITVLGFINGGPTNSTELAIVVFGGIALLIVSALTGFYMRAISTIVGIAVLAEAIHALVGVVRANRGGELGQIVSPGWGLFLSILAGLFLVGSTWIARKTVT